MGKYGTNLEGFGAFEGGVNADKGAPLVSTSSDGETALLFGPAALREIQAGVANGDFAIPPDAAGDTITAENPLPYWTWTPTAKITAAIVADATAGSGQVFQVSLAAASTAETASLTRFIAVAASGDRGLSYVPLIRFGTPTGSAPTFTLRCRYYKQDLTTATGTEFGLEDLVSAAAFIPDDLQHSTIPSDAAYLKITIQFTGKTLAGTAILQEVRVINADTYIFLTEDTPTSTGPGMIRLQTAGVRRFIFDAGLEGTSSSSLFGETLVSSLSSSGTVTSTELLTASANAIVQGDLTVNTTTILNGDNSNWVSRVTATAAQSLTNNTLTKITFNTASSTPTTDSYDPQGWFDNTNDRITVGQDGFYNITANIGFATNATGRRLVQIFVNGSDRGSMQVTASTAGSTLISVSTNIYLVATDYVEVHALQQSGGALNTANTTGVYPVLSVARVGA